VKILILSGGFGTRIAKTINNLPKSLAPINDKPFLYYLIKSFLNQGVNEFVFLLHFKAELIIQFLLHEKETGILMHSSVEYVVEPEPRGTGGAIVYAINKLSISESFLVSNGDTLLSSGIEDISKAKSPAIAIKQEKRNNRFGSVNIKNSKITSFSKHQLNKEIGYINTGLYNLNPIIFSEYRNEKFSIEDTLFPQLAKNGLLNSVIIKGSFIDIGVPEDYKKLCSLAYKNKSF
jgi:D-glycero-alpha-D-manno-heptose 1-phosphate guanylyltransferase